MTIAVTCPHDGKPTTAQRPVCDEHWANLDAVARVAFYSARRAYESNIRDGGAIETFNNAKQHAVNLAVKERTP